MTIVVKVEFLSNVSFYIVHGCSPQKKSFKLSLLCSIHNFFYQQTKKNFINEKLFLKKEKSVAFYTKHIFTAGHTKSQRSESMNSLIKGFGSLKKDIVQWNIYQLMTWLDRCIERILRRIFS